MATDDLTLVERVRTGDQRAFKLLVERYQRKVYSIAVGMLRDREEARDVAQEAFIKVHRYIEYFKGDASFYTWLYRITVNLCIDSIRRKGSRGNDPVEFDESVKMDVAEANIGALGSRLGNEIWSTGMSACGHRKRSGVQMPWSRPPWSTLCTGQPAPASSACTRVASSGAPGAS